MHLTAYLPISLRFVQSPVCTLCASISLEAVPRSEAVLEAVLGFAVALRRRTLNEGPERMVLVRYSTVRSVSVVAADSFSPNSITEEPVTVHNACRPRRDGKS